MIDLDLHLDAVAAGDPDAFARWVAGAEPRLRAALAGFATAVDVEAVVQETLLRAWQVAPRVERDGKNNAFLRLALRAGRNLALDEVRRAQRAKDSVPELAAMERIALGRADSPGDPLLREAIAACREELPPKPAAALTQRLDVGGARSDRELAAALEMRPNTFLKNFGRARKLLYECLRRRGIDVSDYLGLEVSP